MPSRIRIKGLLLAVFGLGGAAAAEPGAVEAVEPGGPGVLTKCRDWGVTRSCKTSTHRPAIADRGGRYAEPHLRQQPQGVRVLSCPDRRQKRPFPHFQPSSPRP